MIDGGITVQFCTGALFVICVVGIQATGVLKEVFFRNQMNSSAQETCKGAVLIGTFCGHPVAAENQDKKMPHD